MSSVAHIIRRRRSKRDRRRKERTRNRLWSLGIVTALSLVVIIPFTLIFGVVGYLYIQSTQFMPSPAESIYLDPIVGVTELYDNTGNTLLYEVSDPLGNERNWLPIDMMPQVLLDATLLMESPNFLETQQFSISRTLNQMWQYVLGLEVSRPNNISARLTRNALLPITRDSQIDPNLLEIVFTSEINRRYDTREILEWHLNTNFYGQDAYGISVAAQVYFGKTALELTVDEIAMLAAIPPAPRFNPIDDITAARGRQFDLLRQMLAQQVITQADFDLASSTLTDVRDTLAQPPRIAPEFSIYAREQAQDILTGLGLDGARMVSRDGLRIKTTLDLDLYYQSECIIRAHLAQLRGERAQQTLALNNTPCSALAYLSESTTFNVSNLPTTSTLIMLDAQTGQIRAMVGDATAYDAQPSLTLHPFAYLEGFLSGEYTPASMVLDIPRPFPGPADGLIYTPSNIDNQFQGPVNLRDAMAGHLLPPAIAIADNRRLNRVISSAHLIGLNSLDESVYDLSILETGGAVSVLDMAYAYSVFATQGVMSGVDTEPIGRNFRARNPVAILEIADHEGNVLWAYDVERQALSRTSIFSPDLGYLINDILADIDVRREIWQQDTAVLNMGRPASIVTGLTGDYAENWAIGYTPQIVTAVHLDTPELSALSLDPHALEGSAVIWQALMRYVHERDQLAVAGWTRPENVVEYVVCEKSGMNPDSNSNCPTRNEIFLREIPPFLTDTFWQTYELNSQTRQLATANTPANLRVESVYFVPPTEALDWWQSNGLPLPPTEYDILSRPEVLKAVQILLPSEFEYVGGFVDVRGTIETDDPISSFQISYGQGLNPTQWFDVGEPQTEFIPGVSLGQWDTSNLDGIYTLQLSVALQDGSRDTDFVQVTIDNVAPTIAITAGESDQVFRFPTDTIIPITATVNDNLAIDRVEFYQNGMLLGIDQEWPYGFDFNVERAGIEIFRAVVFDQVGNSSETELTIEVQRN